LKDNGKNKTTLKGNKKIASVPNRGVRDAGVLTRASQAKSGSNNKSVQKNTQTSAGYEVTNIKKAGNPPSKRSNKESPVLPKHAKSGRTKTKSKKRPMLLFVAFLFVFVSVSSVFIYGGESNSNTTSSFRSFISSFGSGGGYPLTIENSGIVSTQRIGSGIIVLRKDSFEIFNSTAKEIFHDNHSFLNPELDVSNGYAIIYSRASGAVELINRFGVIFETDLDNDILTAAVGKKGNMVIATKSISAQSELTVFDKKGEIVFSWECAAERIAAVALSDDGKSVAVAVIGAADAELYSRVLVFDFDKSESVVERNYPENAVIKLKFGSDDKLITVGDKILSIIAIQDNSKQDYMYGTGVMEKFCMDEDGKTAMILSNFGNKAQSKLVVYSSIGELLYETDLNQEVKWVTCDANYVAALTQDEGQCFDNQGKLRGSFKTDKYSESVLVVGKRCYLFEKGLISQYNTIGLAQ
jgi:hypothetical protein